MAYQSSKGIVESDELFTRITSNVIAGLDYQYAANRGTKLRLAHAINSAITRRLT